MAADKIGICAAQLARPKSASGIGMLSYLYFKKAYLEHENTIIAVAMCHLS